MGEDAKMLALICGLTAACAWAVHDLLVRKIGQGAAILPMMLVVLAAGTVALVLPTLVVADWQAMTGPSVLSSAGAGLAYVLGMGGLYRAFSLAPVRLVAPILGAFPMISLGFAAMGGKAVSWVEAAAVLAIVGGIAIVALTGRDEGGHGTETRAGEAIVWSFAGTIGFATTFWLAQDAARQGDEMASIAVTRVVALVVVLAIALALRPPLRSVAGSTGTLAVMGVLDAVAISLVTFSGRLPNPEYAAISSSLFGVLTILLAWRFLKESVLPRQWLGITTVFAGIAVLSSQG
jgi:drug/metabolite transporter (DMT)-like permease